MRKGNSTGLGQLIDEFFATHEGEHSVKAVAEAVGAAPNTVGQYLLGGAETGHLTRRMNGLARGRHYVYAKATVTPLTLGEMVWYDDNPGNVTAVYDAGRKVTVQWHGGQPSTVSRSDLLTNAEYEELNNE